MTKWYNVKKVYSYSESVEVQAESEQEAEELAMNLVGERNYDEKLEECVVSIISSLTKK
jgi:hypothetical protein